MSLSQLWCSWDIRQWFVAAFYLFIFEPIYLFLWIDIISHCASKRLSHEILLKDRSDLKPNGFLCCCFQDCESFGGFSQQKVSRSKAVCLCMPVFVCDITVNQQGWVQQKVWVTLVTSTSQNNSCSFLTEWKVRNCRTLYNPLN